MSSLQVDQKPVIAILTTSDPNRKFAGNRANFRDLIKTGKQLGFPVYVVTVSDLKLSASQVFGYTYSPEDKKWTAEWFPVPTIVYNRIPNREAETKIRVRRKIAECIKHPGIQLFNPYFFNKWKLFSWLKKSYHTASFVPETKRLTGGKGLWQMLSRHRELYLKPENGKAGKGIMKLVYSPEELKPFKLVIQEEKNIVYKTSRLPLLWKRICRETEHTPYIIQQGIHSTSYQGRGFDLRLLVQKTARGNWAVTGIGARLAGKRRITTHVPQGGSVENPKQMLIPIFGEERTEEMLDQVRSNALIIAQQIERAGGHLLGEMSMDLGIDENGKIWFFEANAKPMKFDEPHIRHRSLQRIFQYSDYLAKAGKA